MEFQKNIHYYGETDMESVGLKDTIDKYLVHLRWFILCILIFPLLTFVFLKFATPEYSIAASILIKDSEKASSITDLSAFESLGLFGNGSNSIENEIQILKSRKLMTHVVKELELNKQYFLKESPIDVQYYSDTPITVIFEDELNPIDFISTSFEIFVRSEDSFDISDFNEDLTMNIPFSKSIKIEMGNEDFKDERVINIVKTGYFSKDLIGSKIMVKVTPINLMTDYLLGRILIESVNNTVSNVLRISMKESVKEKGITVINNLIEQYNADGINDKKIVTQTTTDFLDERIGLISTELEAIESSAEQFKSKTGMVDSKEGANYYLESSSINERDLVEGNTQLELVNYMLEELGKKGSTDLLPGNIGLSDIGIVNNIKEYNELILQRNRVLKSSSVRNPIIVNIDEQLRISMINLSNSLKNLKSSTEIKLSALNTQENKINTRIAEIPKNEREYYDIVRKQETKNALYLFMLQKREESIVSNAVQVNKAKIIDNAYCNGIPISPKKNILYLVSFIMAIVIPFLFIYVRGFLDTKVHSEYDLQKIGAPYLGDIPLAMDKQSKFVDIDDNSNLAEAFRYLRTNLGFILDKKEIGKAIFVTSTAGGEGKTMTTINLAKSLAFSGKKTLLVGLDLRAPKIADYLNLIDGPGVSNFIVNEGIELGSIIEKSTNLENLHVLSSGDIPPNPVELLMSKRVNQIFEFAQNNYEYIVVDTAPVGLVTDTIQISNFADVTIYVVRADVLDKRKLQIPKRLLDDGKLKNMCFLINGVKSSKTAYGYGYSQKEKESIFSRFFNKLRV